MTDVSSNNDIPPLFVYLISDRVLGRRKNTEECNYYIGRSRDPRRRLNEHNRESGFAKGPKATRDLAGLWSLELVLGPFHKGAKEFQLRWKRHCYPFLLQLIVGIGRSKKLGLVPGVCDIPFVSSVLAKHTYFTVVEQNETEEEETIHGKQESEEDEEEEDD